MGDRILAINEFSVVTLNLAEVYMLLSQCDNLTAFTMEYDISVIGKFEPPIPGPEVIKPFSCSIQLSMKFQLLIKTKILTNKGVFCFKSLRCCIYHADKCLNANNCWHFNIY